MQAEKISPSNRRQEPRYRGRCRKLIWRSSGHEPAPGVLCDFSASGAAFLVSERKARPPAAGEELTVRHDAPAAEQQIYQVMRVQKFGTGYLLVGCHRAVDVESMQDGVRLPDLSTAADNSFGHSFRSPRRIAPPAVDIHHPHHHAM